MRLIDRARRSAVDGPNRDDKRSTRRRPRGARIVALDEAGRHAILRVLENSPDELLELRATQIPEAVWRKAEGLQNAAMAETRAPEGMSPGQGRLNQGMPQKPSPRRNHHFALAEPFA